MTTALDHVWRKARRLRNHSRNKAIRDADLARDSGNPAQAAMLYQAVIDRWGPHFGLLVQLGNALKDSGAFERAEQVYQSALRLSPQDADCHLQLGHLMKLAGFPHRAEAFYVEANRLAPDLAGALVELRALEASRESAAEDIGFVETQEYYAIPARGPAYTPASDCHSRAFIVHQRLMVNLVWRRN